METIYLDNNATTRPADEAARAMVSFLSDHYANPSSMHRPGQDARKAIDEARSKVARLIGCSASELVFTSGGTESINTAIRGLVRSRRPKMKIITSTVEHSATRGVCDWLKTEGVEIYEVGVDKQGLLDLDQLRSLVADDVALVSIMWVNNETGVILQIPEIAAICRAAKVPFHCDGTQALGKIPVDVKAAGVDLLSFSGHKFHGPKGVGGLYIRRGTRLATLISGGPQESGRRGGTENVPGIVGMGVASELAIQHLADMPKVADLRDRLESGILSTIPRTTVHGSKEHRVPNTTNIGFARLQAEAILMLLSEKGICASAGAACSSGSLEPSHVLRAMNADPKVAHGAIRFSLSHYTSEWEIDKTLELLPGVIERLRVVLPVG